MVHAEVVLKGNRSESLCSGFHFYVFLSFYRLVETVTPAATFHNTSRLFVNNFYLTVHYDVVYVEVEHRIRLQELLNGVNTLTLYGIVGIKCVFALNAFFIGKSQCLKRRNFCRNVGKDKECFVTHLLCQPSSTLIREVARVHLFIRNEIEGSNCLRHALVIVLHVNLFRTEHTRLHSRFREELDEGFVLGKRLVRTEKLEETLLTLFLIIRIHEFLRLSEELRSQLLLNSYEFFHKGLVLLKQLYVTLGHRSRNDERRTGIVDKHRVSLVDNSEIVHALHEILGTHCHIVAQVVETEFIVCTIRDVGLVSTTARFGIGLVLIDTVHRKFVEQVKGSVPSGVTFCQIVVDRYDMHTVTRKCVQIDRQGRCKRLTFTRSHFGNFSLMDCYATKQLARIGVHVPVAFFEVVIVERFVTINLHYVRIHHRHLTVEVRSSKHSVKTSCAVLKTSASRFYDSKGCGEHFVKFFFVALQNFLFKFVNFLENKLTLFNRSFFSLSLKHFDFFAKFIA